MKRGTKSPYSEYLNKDCRLLLTETEHDFVKAKALLDNKHIQDVVREIIDKAYESEKRNGVDVIALAKEYELL